MITTFASAALEKIINQYLQLDPQTFDKLTEFEGNVILIHFTDWDLKFYFVPNATGVSVLHQFSGTPDTTINGTTLNLLKLHKSTDFTDVTIEGDVELGQKIRHLLQTMDIDWEEQLAKIAGDIIAHRVANTTRNFFQWCKRTTTSLRQDLTEYLQEETRQLPPRQEIEDFFQDVAELRHQVERAEARVNVLIEDS